MRKTSQYILTHRYCAVFILKNYNVGKIIMLLLIVSGVTAVILVVEVHVP
jgi:hypothetical protein